uniref:Netrin-1 n=1 Tax=Mola mola TaxID=94237 RepID=A0A3Q3VQH8_MOLML
QFLTHHCLISVALTADSPSPSLSVSRCVDHACSPPIGNLASGRALFALSHRCGNSSSLHLCPDDTHPPALMTDDPFLHPDTWWASGAQQQQQQRDEIRLDLETRFCLSHVILVFRSPRPAAMAIERSADFGKTWEALKLYAQNCSADFGLPDDFSQPGSLCTSRYSSASPCTGGESCPMPVHHPAGQMTPYAISTLLARGTCLCHGHADRCVQSLLMWGDITECARCVLQVSGRCLCVHHTAGDHCEKCAPLYNDRPWMPANSTSGESNPCQKCQCHSHADSCHFSQRAWLSSAGTTGGVCDDCKHNTVGRRCHRCRHGYRRYLSLPLNSPHACTRCWCHPEGSLPPRPGEDRIWCHPRSGQCLCKPGVGGTSCSYCLPGYWGFSEEGCKPCICPHNCDPTTGQCLSITQCLRTGKCSCKEKKLRNVSDLCKTKHDYVIKVSVLSADDKGSHAEVKVKVRKVFHSGPVALSLGTISIYPLSWTSRGCTCPILNPGMEYLLAGPQEAGTGRLLVTMQSTVLPWTPRLGLLLSEGLQNRCP